MALQRASSTTRARRTPLRVWTQSQPEGVDCGEGDGIEESPGELVVAGGDAAKVLEAADRGLDPPALAVAALVVADRHGTVAAAWNDGIGAGGAQGCAKPIGIVGTIGDQATEGPGLGQELRRGTDVGVMAGREMEDDGASEQVGDQMDFGASPAPGYANGLIFRRFFWAPAAERWAFT